MILEHVQGLATLHSVLRWALAESPPAEVVDVVVQDEFTHDVIFRVEPNIFLVFDTTRLGAVMAVAIWNHAPRPTSCSMRD
jgi:hypothetical protein